MATHVENRRVLLKNHVKGMVSEEDMELHTSTLPLALKDGSTDVLLQNLFLSVDPYMRGRMSENTESYFQSFSPGEVIYGGSVAKVVLSNNPDFQEGDIVTGLLGWEDYTIVPGGNSLQKITSTDFPLSYYLGVLGMPGLTAYAGLYSICEPKAGEQVFVSAASGAVGQLVGQYAKLKGCYVVGTAGSQKKVELLKTKFGYDDAFNYKEENDLKAALKRYCPKGIDIYFENVGGKMLEAVLDNMNKHGRISVCGMISQYNLKDHEAVHNLVQLIIKSIKMQGFLVLDYYHLYPQFVKETSSYIKEGKIKYVEDIEDGLEKAPSALVGLFKGENIGKKIVRLA